MATRPVSVNDLRTAIEKLEQDCDEYKARKRKDVDEEVKQIALEQLLPEPLKTHISLYAERLNSYGLMRAEVFKYAERVGQERLSSEASGASPMELDSLARRGKGGKDKNGKGSKARDKVGKGKGQSEDQRPKNFCKA